MICGSDTRGVGRLGRAAMTTVLAMAVAIAASACGAAYAEGGGPVADKMIGMYVHQH